MSVGLGPISTAYPCGTVSVLQAQGSPGLLPGRILKEACHVVRRLWKQTVGVLDELRVTFPDY